MNADGSDYAYSTFTDSQLHDWAVSKGLIEPEAKKQRKQLLELIKTPYNEAASSFYETWSDSQLVSVFSNQRAPFDTVADSFRFDSVIGLPSMVSSRPKPPKLERVSSISWRRTTMERRTPVSISTMSQFLLPAIIR